MKKGFTLIELLAVIVILAIISLIATPIVLNVIEKSKKGAAESSAIGYINALENKIVTSLVEGVDYIDKDYAYDEIDVDIKGNIPTSGTFSIKKHSVEKATFCINGYMIEYKDSEAKATDKCNSGNVKNEGSITLSSTSGTIAIGNSTDITVTSTGDLSCRSSDESIATCSVSDKTITINGVSIGSAVITITSISTNDYKKTSTTYNVTIREKYLEEKVSLGDYISMTPTSTSFTTDTSITGYTSSETLNPSELNLWRVIRINDDGTIDVVSEYVSSVEIHFMGQTGYKNLVGYLNVIASQYTNSLYVKSTRIIGYNGQTEYLTDTADSVDSTSTTSPWSSTTSDNSNESKGGGDTLYTVDTDLVTAALGTLVANKVGTTTSTNYWLGSRYFNYLSSTDWYYSVRGVYTGGNISNYFTLWFYYSGFYTYSNRNAVRPILTLKSGLSSVGSGTSSDPYVLP